jgi:very-short-patch-repair endonuclease
MGKGEPCVRTAFPQTSLSLKGRGTAAQPQGEGILGRGKTPDELLRNAKALRTNMTEAEARIWSRLRAGRLKGHKFRRQVSFSADYIADFVCPAVKLIVEVDGSQHADQTTYDERRTRFFETQGYRVIRFWNNDVLARTEDVLTAILAAIEDPPLPAATRLSLSPLGRGSENLLPEGEGV